MNKVADHENKKINSFKDSVETGARKTRYSKRILKEILSQSNDNQRLTINKAQIEYTGQS